MSADDWKRALEQKEDDRMKVQVDGKEFSMRDNQMSQLRMWADGKAFDKSWLKISDTGAPSYFWSQKQTKDLLILREAFRQQGGRGAQARRAVSGSAGLDELGQTNTPIVGKNFNAAIIKAGMEMRYKQFVHLINDMKDLGFTKLAAKLEPLVKDANKDGPVGPKEAVWKALAHAYTLEDSGDCDADGNPMCLYWMMNRAIRFDDPSLNKWASCIGGLSMSGYDVEEPNARHVMAPASVRARVETQAYRGFALPASLVSSYPKDKVFFWQAFVSTSLNRQQSLNFALKNASGAMRPYLFTIKVPKYKDTGGKQLYHFLLKSVSAFEEEEELLLMPFTRFQVTKEPFLEDGCWHVHLKALDAPLVTCSFMAAATLWVDPRGFYPGSPNHELAKRLFRYNCPGFHRSKEGKRIDTSWGGYTSYSTVPGVQTCIGLFTDTDEAMKWLAEEQEEADGAIHVKIVVTGGVSEAVFGTFFKSSTMPACDLMVYCEDTAMWDKVWQDISRIKVTDSADDVEKFMQTKSYRSHGDEWTPAHSSVYNDTEYFYPFIEMEKGGVVYGASGDFQRTGKADGPFKKSGGKWPDMPFHPFEK